MKLHWADGNGGRRAIELGESYNDFVGADYIQAGESGLVPAPAAGDQKKILLGGGAWAPFTLDTVQSAIEGAVWLTVN